MKVVLEGDFRQILPDITKGKRADSKCLGQKVIPMEVLLNI